MKPKVAPREGKVNARGTHGGSNVMRFKVLCDKALRPGLSHRYGAAELDPDLVDVEIRPPFERDSDTVDVDGGSLEATQFETLLDDRLVVRNVRRPVFVVNVDGDCGCHGGSYHETEDCVSHGQTRAWSLT